jgi:HEAT repeat protein
MRSREARLVSGSVRIQGEGSRDRDPTPLAANRGLASLARALDDPDPALRARAVAVVCELGDVRAREVVKTMLLDPSPMVRSAAVRSAARVGTTEVLGSLIVALTDSDAEVRAAAVDAVNGMTGRRLSSERPDGHLDPAEIEDLKRWWRDRRFAELVRFVEP